jgi:ketosteroid isomerase-like protein
VSGGTKGANLSHVSEEKMQSSQNIKNEILSLEKRFWGAMQSHNLQEALGLTYFPCVVAGEHGLQAVDREQFEKMFNGQKNVTRNFSIDESKAEVQQVNDDTAIIAYTVHSSLEKDGQPKEVDAVDTSTWVRKDGKWLCAMHTETMLQH